MATKRTLCGAVSAQRPHSACDRDAGHDGRHSGSGSSATDNERVYFDSVLPFTGRGRSGNGPLIGEPRGDARAEHSLCLVRDGVKPLAWIDHETRGVSICSDADSADIRAALIGAMVQLRDLVEAERARAKSTTHGPFTVEYVPAKAAPGGTTKPNWRISDARDDRVATCYTETDADLVCRLMNLGAAEGRPSVVEVRHEHALESDPYAFEGKTFADVVAIEATRNEDRAALIVRQRILDDVEQSHRMLDEMQIPPGNLTARLALAIFESRKPSTFVEGSTTFSVPAIDRPYNKDDRRRDIRGPVADVDDVKIPDAATVLPKLLELSGEDAFRIFERLGLTACVDRDVIQSWVLTDPTSVAEMVRTCGAIALDTGTLGELAQAVADHEARAKA